MEFYEIKNLKQEKNSPTGLGISIFSKLLENISENTVLKTMDSIGFYNVVILGEGSFSEDNPDLYYKGQIKERKQVIPYCLVTTGKEFNLKHKDESYSATIVNGNLLVSSSGLLSSLVKEELDKFKDLTVEETSVLNWLESGKTGLSSLTLCSALYPKFNNIHNKLKNLSENVPHDIQDFKRIQSFLKEVPQAQSRLADAKQINSTWSALVDNWSILEEKANAKDSESVYQILKSCETSKSLKII